MLLSIHLGLCAFHLVVLGLLKLVCVGHLLLVLGPVTAGAVERQTQSQPYAMYVDYRCLLKPWSGFLAMHVSTMKTPRSFHRGDHLSLLADDVRFAQSEDNAVTFLDQLRDNDWGLVNGCELEHDLGPRAVDRHEPHELLPSAAA